MFRREEHYKPKQHRLQYITSELLVSQLKLASLYYRLTPAAFYQTENMTIFASISNHLQLTIVNSLPLSTCKIKVFKLQLQGTKKEQSREEHCQLCRPRPSLTDGVSPCLQRRLASNSLSDFAVFFCIEFYPYPLDFIAVL